MTRPAEAGYWRAVRVWWAFSWRWPLLMLIPLLPLALFVALIKPEPRVTRQIVSFCTWPMVFWAQIEAVRRVLKMDFGRFSVRVMEKQHE